MEILFLKSLIFEGRLLETRSCLAIHLLGSELFGASSEIFGCFRQSSDVFGNLRLCSCPIPNPTFESENVGKYMNNVGYLRGVTTLTNVV